jgi:PhnB protein
LLHLTEVFAYSASWAIYRGGQKQSAASWFFVYEVSSKEPVIRCIRKERDFMNTQTSMKVVQPYLFFNGKCEEALNFYKSAIGAEITALMRFKEAPPMPAGDAGGAGEGCGPGTPDPEKIMHASFKIGQSEIMASDGCSDGTPKFEGFALSIALSTEAEADRIFNALSQGGKVTMPMGPTFYAVKFGMLEDRFGMGWMIIVPLPMK